MAEAYHCTGSAAERELAEHHALTMAVLEARMAEQAVELFNQGQKGAEEMAKTPALGELLLEIVRAQRGTMATLADVPSRPKEEE